MLWSPSGVHTRKHCLSIAIEHPSTGLMLYNCVGHGLTVTSPASIVSGGFESALAIFFFKFGNVVSGDALLNDDIDLISRSPCQVTLTTIRRSLPDGK